MNTETRKNKSCQSKFKWSGLQTWVNFRQIILKSPLHGTVEGDCQSHLHIEVCFDGISQRWLRGTQILSKWACVLEKARTGGVNINQQIISYHTIWDITNSYRNFTMPLAILTPRACSPRKSVAKQDNFKRVLKPHKTTKIRFLTSPRFQIHRVLPLLQPKWGMVFGGFPTSPQHVKNPRLQSCKFAQDKVAKHKLWLC